MRYFSFIFLIILLNACRNDFSIQSISNEDLKVAKNLMFRGDSLLVKQKFENAYLNYEEAIQKFNAPTHDTTYMSIANRLIGVSLIIDSLVKANQYISYTQSIYDNGFSYEIGKIESKFRKAQMEFKLGGAAMAAKIAKEALQDFQDLKEDNEKNTYLEVELSTFLSKVYYEIDPSTALQYSEVSVAKAKNLSSSERQKILLLDALAFYAKNILFSTNDFKLAFDNAEMVFEEALSIEKNYNLRNTISYSNVLDVYTVFLKYKGIYYPPFQNERAEKTISYNKKALQAANESLKIIKSILGNDNTALGQSLNGVSICGENQDEKKRYLLEGIRILENKFGKKGDDIGLMYNNIARGEAVINKDYLSSLYYFQKSLISLNIEFEDTNIFTNPNLESYINGTYYLEILEQKALALKKQYEVSDSIEYLQYSLETFLLTNKLLNKIRNEQNFMDFKQLFQTGYYYLYPKTLRTAYELYDITKDLAYIDTAYTAVQYARAGILNDRLKNLEGKKNMRISKDILNKEKQLEQHIYKLTQRIRNEQKRSHILADNKNLLQLQDSLLITKNELVKLRKLIEKQYPNYHSLNTTKLVSSKEVRQAIKADEVILEYFTIGDENIFAFAIFKDSMLHWTIQADKYYKEAVKSLQNGLSHYNYPIADFSKASALLYEKLIKPIASQIKNKDLVIIPDGELHYTPFEVLMEYAPESNWKKLPYILKEHSVQYAFSVNNYLSKDISSEAVNNGDVKVLAFAPFSDESFSTSDKRGLETLLSLRANRDEIGQLAYSTQEINAINKNFSTNIYKEGNAHKSNFITEAATNYDILHLSTHGIVNDSFPDESALVFRSEKDTSQIEFLTIGEIYGLEINAKLTVLSACRTGYGAVLRGEGAISLARSFAYAGCPSLVMTLWNVNDFSTANIIASFYTHLHNGTSSNKALQKAKLEFLSDANRITSHPYYWAGLISTGVPTRLN